MNLTVYHHIDIMYYRKKWLCVILSFVTVKNIHSLDNAPCPSTGYYCPSPFNNNRNNECITAAACKKCKPCSTNAYLVTDCVWKTFTDTKKCACNNGYEGTTEGSTCTLCPSCPANSYQTAPCTSCTCNSGYYWDSYYSICNPCVSLPENGYHTASCSSWECNSGYFQVLYMNNAVVRICMKALTCNSNSYIISEGQYYQYCACNSGSYSVPNTTTITTMDINKQAVSYLLRENNCAPCTVCSLNAKTSGTCRTYEVTDFTCECNAGYYGHFDATISSQTSCLDCPKGTYSSSGGFTACKQCPLGKYSRHTDCATCNVGMYADVTLNTCVGCNAGYFASSTGLSSCDMCLAGTYSLSVECIACAPGKYSGNASSSCVSCSPGTFSDAPAVSECKLCESGFYSSQSSALECSTCSNGTFSRGGSWGCQECEPGTYSFAGFSTCWECEVGQYQSDYGSSSCDSCSLNFTFSSHNRSSSCSMCTVCDTDNNYYYTKKCDLVSDASCQTCTICMPGEFMESECTTDSDRVCPVCPECSNETYLKSGCVDGLRPICEPCTQCSGQPLVNCTPLDDTVCSFHSDCHVSLESFREFSWMLDGSIPPNKFKGCTKGQYISELNPLVCKDCPEWLHGPNGLWCEPCKGYQEPYIDQTSCVCIFPSVVKTGNVCECDIGFYVNQQGCQPCKQGTFKNFSVVLDDNWWDQDVPCSACPLGKWSNPQASSCYACLPGQYRTDNTGCQSCLQGFYALDPADSTSCVACNESCSPGYLETPCPLYDLGDKFVCQQCPLLPPNASWTEKCFYDCMDGYYNENNTCVQCSILECPLGYHKTECTTYADMDCDVPCVNNTKPPFNSEWDRACTWKCQDGYQEVALDYSMWTQYECILGSTRPFWLW